MTPEERAVAAVARFETLRRTLTAFARALTGDPAVTVRAGVSSGTDGRVIALRPPSVLADTVQHVFGDCGRRSDAGDHLCAACEQLELVYVTLFHEISHITAGSMVRQQPGRLRHVAECGAAAGTDGYRKFVLAAMDRLRASPSPVDIYAAAMSVHPALLAFTRAADDVRIDRAAAAARPGVRTMRFHQAERILSRGIDQVDGSLLPWRDQPIEAQVPAAALVHLHGHTLDGRFDDVVIEALASREFAAVLDGADPAGPLDALELAVAMLGVAHQLGLYELPIEEDDDDEPDLSGNGGGDSGDPDPDNRSRDDDDSDGSADGGDGSGGTGDPAAEADSDHGDGDVDDDSQGDGSSSDPDQGDRGAGDDGSDAGPSHSGEPMDSDGPGVGDGGDRGLDPGRGDGTGAASPDRQAGRDVPRRAATLGDLDRALHEITGHGELEDGPALDEKALRRAIEQTEVFDSYSRTVSGLDVFPPGQGDAFEGGWLEHFEIPGAHLMLPIMRARRIFAESSLDRYDGGLRAGRLDPRALGRRAWSGDDRLFRRRVRAEGIDFEVVIGLDISASTEFAPERLAMIRQAGEGLCGVLSRIGVQCSMYAHTAVQDSGGWRQQIYTVKGRSEMWTTTVRARIGQLRSIVGSLDGHNLEFYRKALDRSPARGRLIVYFTDGVIPEQNTAEEREIILREAEICRQRGYSLMAVGVQNDSPKNFGFDTVRLDSGDDIVTVLNELESRITSKDSVNRKR